jgi:hypothetical protein
LEPVFLLFLRLRFRNLKYWNSGRYLLLRKPVRSNDYSNLVLIAGARALAGNVSGNLSLMAFGVRRDSDSRKYPSWTRVRELI